MAGVIRGRSPLILVFENAPKLCCGDIYYQDWLVDPNSPVTCRHNRKEAGSGAHGDMNAHLVDLARYLAREIDTVSGAQKIFVKERPLVEAKGTGIVTTDDATHFLAWFQNAALGSFLASRLATGRKNYLCLQIFGSNGSLLFNLERLNESQFYSRKDNKIEQGFRTIIVTEQTHPYMSAWWPPGHTIGWEHTFIHEVSDLLLAIDQSRPVYSDFYDGLRCQQVLDAVSLSVCEGRQVNVPSEEEALI